MIFHFKKCFCFFSCCGAVLVLVHHLQSWHWCIIADEVTV